MKDFKFVLCITFAILCLSICKTSYAQWHVSGYTGYTVSSTLSPPNDPDACNLTIGTNSVSASTLIANAQANATIYRERSFNWSGQGAAPALFLVFSAQISGSATGSISPLPIATSYFQPNPSTQFQPASFAAPPSYSGTVTYNEWQATPGGVSSFTASMQITANAQNATASAYTLGDVSRSN